MGRREGISGTSWDSDSFIRSNCVPLDPAHPSSSPLAACLPVSSALVLFEHKWVDLTLSELEQQVRRGRCSSSRGAAIWW